MGEFRSIKDIQNHAVYYLIMSFTISKTEKNKPLLLSNGFCYIIDRSTDKKTYWKCELSRTDKCKGRLHTDLQFTTILSDASEHNHPGSAVKVEVRLFNEKIRERAVETTESTQEVIDHCLTDASDPMVARLPNFKHVKRTIQRRREINDLPKIPHDKNFTGIPTSLTVTSRGEKFLQFDSGPGDQRILIFASEKQLDIFADSDHILIDGTFKVRTLIDLCVNQLHVFQLR